MNLPKWPPPREKVTDRWPQRSHQISASRLSFKSARAPTERRPLAARARFARRQVWRRLSVVSRNYGPGRHRNTNFVYVLQGRRRGHLTAPNRTISRQAAPSSPANRWRHCARVRSIARARASADRPMLVQSLGGCAADLRACLTRLSCGRRLAYLATSTIPVCVQNFCAASLG